MDSNGKVSPIFFVEVFFEKKEESIVFTKESVSLEFNHYLLTKSHFNLEEINKIRLEIDEEQDFHIKLEKIKDLLSFDTTKSYSDLDQKPLIVNSSPQLINKAILYVGGKMGITQGLIDELEKLKKVSKQELKGTSISSLFWNSEKEKVPKENEILEIFQLNNSQEKAVVKAISNNISVITGPPGTGKSQVVLNIIANAVWNNKSVLFASKNNQAVDVVNTKLRSILSKNLVVRMGSSKHRKNATLQIHKLFQNKKSIKISKDYKSYTTSIRDRIQKIDDIRTKINYLSNLNDKIESIQEKIDNIRSQVPKNLQKKFKIQDYQFLASFNISNDIKECEINYYHSERAKINGKKCSNQLDDLRDKYIKPKKTFKLAKNDLSVKELDLNTAKIKISKINANLNETRQDLLNLEEKRKKITQNANFYYKFKKCNSNNIDELEIKKTISLLFNEKGKLKLILEKIFPNHYLKKRFNLLKSIINSLDLEIKEYIQENTEFSTKSIRNSLEILLNIKKLSLLTKEESLYKSELKNLEKNTNKIVKQYFDEQNNSKRSYISIIENLDHLIYLNKKLDCKKDIKKYKSELTTLQLQEKEIYNSYHKNLTNQVKKYFDSKIENGFMTQKFLPFLVNQKNAILLQNKINAIETTLLDNPSIYNLQIEIYNLKEDKIKYSRKVFEAVWINRLKNTTPSEENHISRYFDASEKLEKYIEDYSLWKRLKEEQESEIQALLPFLPVWIVTNLSAKNSLPLKEKLFDLLVIDEASQCDIASAIPLLFRSKQVVIIGDPKQLKHISILKGTEDKKIASKNEISELYLDYAYSKNSIYDITERVIKDKNEIPILLNQHYRSHKDIISFSNKHFYEDKLNIMTDHSQLLPNKIHVNGIKWVDIRGKTIQNKSPYNKEEAFEIINILIEYSKLKNKKFSIGIVTLFRAQMELISDLIKKTKELKDLDITVGTTHRFQGDEKDIILFSPAISIGIKESTLNWVHTTTQLLNVAITRAKSVFIVVGDKKKCKEAGGLLKYLTEHSDNNQESNMNFDSTIEEKLYNKLTMEGIKVIPQFSTKVKDKKLYCLDFALFVNNNKYDLEIDGDKAHSQKIESDLLRDIHLRMDGWKVRRYQASEINNNLDKVVEGIKRLC
ncbi:AAA family ATPase [Candidatus Woesearchaeota archaeon]|nr:AAA family ATPase [Candidatus Woesearchaeota archaeon]